MLPAAPGPATLPPFDPTVRHPDWCMPGSCETTASETLHRSAPIVWLMDGDDADVIMQRCQYGGDSAVFYEVRLTHRAFIEEITLTFSEHDMARLFAGVRELRGSLARDLGRMA